MKTADLAAERRLTRGKNAARQLRVTGKIPAVFYGQGSESIALAVKYQDLVSILHGQESRNTLLNLRIDSGSEEPLLSLPKDIQFDPVEGNIIHMDFQQVHLDRPINTQVPIHLVGSSPGVAQGGVLEHLRRELDIECLPMDIPDFFEVDISTMEIGDSVHVSDLNLSEKIRILSDAHQTIILVAAPTVEKVAEEVEPEEGELAEGEEPAKADEGEESPKADSTSKAKKD